MKPKPAAWGGQPPKQGAPGVCRASGCQFGGVCVYPARLSHLLTKTGMMAKAGSLRCDGRTALQP